MFSCSWRKFNAFRKHVRAFTNMVRVVEVGPRDGLQNINAVLPTGMKIKLINQLSQTGLRSIEVTSFVSPKWVPQMADSSEVYKGISKYMDVDYSVLVPNVKGLEKALSLGVKEVVIFTAATDSFTHHNTNCTIKESLRHCITIRQICKERKIRTRAVISCVAGCPYEGEVKPTKVAKVAETLLDIGCYEIGLGDTIGVATPKKMGLLFNEIRAMTGGDIWRFAVHCHDTYGQAVANIYECLRQGIRVFDSSVAGLGGCPYAPGSSGNVSTEDLVYLLHGEGMETGIDLDKLVDVGNFISEQICVPNRSKVGNACLSKTNEN
ncbi:PREDICTED: hydroxymethylglutaryl-CoA lyase, mitochondrial [Ceratosolen solmsi marchali]|uniref:hydroxymethylglutaryl-CoA lyase n=1 Tax=Ceratosolen solmsi marchali TaxID=326594 RepID=A0AAJ6YXF1_9HYME|nr:PREDICTED: hydroxymethylglutaryl-CoA lyase, mitochondrial [Ceratosolen solmsi marchali]